MGPEAVADIPSSPPRQGVTAVFKLAADLGTPVVPPAALDAVGEEASRHTSGTVAEGVPETASPGAEDELDHRPPSASFVLTAAAGPQRGPKAGALPRRRPVASVRPSPLGTFQLPPA